MSRTGFRSNVNSILEGLVASRNFAFVTEGTSVFSSKLDSFIKDLTSSEKKFVKDSLNKLFLGISKDGNGYIEGKRPVTRDKMNYKVMTMKIQTKDSFHRNFYEVVPDYLKPLGCKTFNKSIDGVSYICISPKLSENDDIFMSSNKFGREFSLESSVVVGISELYGNDKVDKSGSGSAFKIVVSVPNAVQAVNNNEFVTKSGSEYIFFNDKEFEVTYDSGTRRFRTSSGSGYGNTFVVLYKGSANAEKAFKELYSVYDKNTTKKDVENILSKNKVSISTSYYPGLD